MCRVAVDVPIFPVPACFPSEINRRVGTLSDVGCVRSEEQVRSEEENIGDGPEVQSGRDQNTNTGYSHENSFCLSAQKLEHPIIRSISRRQKARGPELCLIVFSPNYPH